MLFIVAMNVEYLETSCGCTGLKPRSDTFFCFEESSKLIVFRQPCTQVDVMSPFSNGLRSRNKNVHSTLLGTLSAESVSFPLE